MGARIFATSTYSVTLPPKIEMSRNLSLQTSMPVAQPSLRARIRETDRIGETARLIWSEQVRYPAWVARYSCGQYPTRYQIEKALVVILGTGHYAGGW